MGQHYWYKLVRAQSQKNTGGQSCGPQARRPKGIQGIQGQGLIPVSRPGFPEGKKCQSCTIPFFLQEPSLLIPLVQVELNVFMSISQVAQRFPMGIL
ncbi:hypothetical protein DSO57_1016682 [Entomophthora muscae]|uniref:Uncharacterized protein n=1 Tax=Entomophthora muscae TaxID=34485 RepID=A0ACC2UQ49_9FUNG|nr:hypothetical protein DSO57_1016682 [Entomophthora muscae]